MIFNLVSLLPQNLARRILLLFPKPAQERLKYLFRQYLSRQSTKAAPSQGGKLKACEGFIEVSNLNPDLTSGVNVVGFARGMLGLGEMARSAVRSLQAVQVPVHIVNYNKQLQHKQEDCSVDALLSDTLSHKVNLFSFNPDTLFAYARDYGNAPFAGHYNIHYMAWELENYPDLWMPAFGLVDEVWTISTFIQQSMAKSSTVPVIAMGQEVRCTPSHQHRRAFFGIPDDSFAFLFSLDLSSVIKRKNPEGVIKAFQLAFEKSNRDVVLVIKVSSVAERSDHQDQVAWLKSQTADDQRIIILNTVLSRPAMEDLLNVCDCYVSLHRAEGFGYGMAEAMLLGKPVIATNYSGNLDFMRPDNSCLVRCSMVPVNKGDYIFEQGQLWADPDIIHAAEWMQKITTDAALRTGIGAQAQTTIRTQFNADVIGRKYKQRLKLLGLI